MPDPVNGLLAARMDPERRRRIGNALMAQQYDRETPQDAPVTDRAGLFPLATYANGQTGIAWPGIIATPFEKMAQVLRGEITPGTPEFNEAGFDIAGAAMVGGLAAARPRGSLGMSGRPTEPQGIRAFRGQPDDASLGKSYGAVWATNNADLADVYAMTKTATNTNGERWAENLRPRVMPVELKFKNPLSVGGDNISTWDNISHNGMNFTTDQLAAYAKAQGHDGLIVNNVIDGARSIPQTSYAALERGTVYSPLTGALLYANARPGAALGAGLSGASERQGIRAYHGTPHDFDKFDMSKIGTGEGAQAYGYGLYFAENEGVAKQYRDRITATDGRLDARGLAARTLDAFENDKAKAIASLEARKNTDETFNSRVDEAISWIKNDGARGRLYEVNIKADPDEFLDWDKPLSQQSEKVRGAIQAFDPEMSPSLRDNYTGQTFMRDYSGYVSDGYAKSVPEVSQALRDAGIPGIKYLDQGSRSTGEGSRNYVVFDANLIEILRKYGLLGMLGAGGMAQELMKPSKPNIPDDAA